MIFSIFLEVLAENVAFLFGKSSLVRNSPLHYSGQECPRLAAALKQKILLWQSWRWTPGCRDLQP
jgi:hypothetical protein